MVAHRGCACAAPPGSNRRGRWQAPRSQTPAGAHRLHSIRLHGHGVGVVHPAGPACTGGGGAQPGWRVGAGGGRLCGRPPPAAAASPAGRPSYVLEPPAAASRRAAGPGPARRPPCSVLEYFRRSPSSPVRPASECPTDADARSAENSAPGAAWESVRQAAPGTLPRRHSGAGPCAGDHMQQQGWHLAHPTGRMLMIMQHRAV